MQRTAGWIAVAVAAGIGGAGAQERGLAERIIGERFPGAEVLHDAARSYDEAVIYVAPFEDREPAASETLEGQVGETLLEVPPGRSTLEVFRAYTRALEGEGFAERFACTDAACGVDYSWWYGKEKGITLRGTPTDQRFAVFERVADGAREVLSVLATARPSAQPEDAVVWVFLEAVSTEAEEEGLATLDAEGIAAAIAATGTAAIYGLEFETDSAVLTPDAEPVLAEMAGYLRANPAIEVLIVGHTDNVGALDYNMDLSERRAGAVREALAARHGIAGARMSAHGVGFLAPKAPNDGEAGRAANRRVEMVLR